MTGVLFRPIDPDSWESHDWRWHIVARPKHYPDNGERSYSVKDYVEEAWLEEDFPTLTAAMKECSRRQAEDLA